MRHRDIQADKDDTSDNLAFAQVRKRIFAPSDPTDGPAVPKDERFALEMYNVAGIGVHSALIAVALTGALRSEKVAAMAVHSAINTRVAAVAAGAAPFRHGPRLVALGKEAADAVAVAGQHLGHEDKSDLFGAAGTGADHDAVIKSLIGEVRGLIDQIAAAEHVDAQRIKAKFTAVLPVLHPYFAGKT